MKHKHSKLIAIWNEDNSTEFEFAYGTGADFYWVDCDITHVINNPAVQVRVKDLPPKKEKRWIVAGNNSLHTMMYFSSPESASRYDTNGVDAQIIEIEVEV